MGTLPPKNSSDLGCLRFFAALLVAVAIGLFFLLSITWPVTLVLLLVWAVLHGTRRVYRHQTSRLRRSRWLSWALEAARQPTRADPLPRPALTRLPGDTTDAEGLAATALTLGEELGTYTVVATVADLQPVTFTITAKATPDFDGDGEVGFEDFYLFAGAFGGSDPRFDLDGSGTVDFAGFFLFAEHFGQPQRAKLVALARERLGLPQLQQNAPTPSTVSQSSPGSSCCQGQCAWRCSR